MSDEYTGPGRDGNATADGSGTAQHPVPAYAGAGPGVPPPGGPYPGGPHPGFGPPTMLAPRPPRPNRTMTGIVAAALIAGLVGGGAGFGGAYALLDGGTASATLTSSPATSGATDAAPGSVAAAAQKAMPSTVDIRVQQGQGVAEGSGVILTADGNVLTNNHVVAGSNGTISVTLADGSEHPATVVGTSPSYDLAVIKLQGVSGLTPATLGQGSDVQVGQPVVAIGSPQGLTGTVTTGIISAFNRTVQVQGQDGSGVVYNGLQTDTSINPGNSGGPLVNLDGQVIGINSAIATSGQNSGSIGLGFAIPIDQAKRVAQEIMTSGTATKPVLGVQGGADSSSAGTDGARIAAVQPGSPAAQAGLVTGDVVSKVGDAKVEDFSDLVARIGSYAPGQQVTLTVGSGGSERTVQVTLGSRPDQAASTGTGGESNTPFGNPFGQGGGN
jgi:putative serine protease PepD